METITTASGKEFATDFFTQFGNNVTLRVCNTDAVSVASAFFDASETASLTHNGVTYTGYTTPCALVPEESGAFRVVLER